jgi:glucan phosphoethanolaminetransferase (alkaline phosphatase superfamily)
VLANLVDAEYYKFTGHRMNLDVLFFKSEAVEQLDQFLIHYWHLFGLAGIAFFALYRFFPTPLSSPRHAVPPTLSTWQRTAQAGSLMFVGLFVLLFGVRGGFQPKPLQPIHAYSSGASPELGVLTLNSSFTLLKTRRGVALKPVHFFSSTADVFSQLKQKKKSSRRPAAWRDGSQKQNVVILVLESFGAEFWGSVNHGRGFTPFLDELAKQGALFKNNYANGRRSIDALPAIFFGVPSFVPTPIVKTNYYANRWNGLGHIAKRAGVHASFFHGAPKGTMYFDAIAAMAGFDNYYPLESYPNPKDFDGHWGIYDEPFLQFAVNKINEQPQPFLSTVFTISSHQPYHIPPQYADVIPRGRMQIHQSIGYVDYALKRFFEEARKQPWYENTLFIITGDHTQMSESELKETNVGRHQVPLLLFHPAKKLSEVNTQRVTHHSDILPTILDFWGIDNEPYLLFGRSVFDPTQQGEAVFYTFGGYWLVRESYFLHFSDQDHRGTLYASADAQQLHPILNQESLRGSMEGRMKLYIQYYNNSLIQNNLYSWFDL